MIVQAPIYREKLFPLEWLTHFEHVFQYLFNTCFLVYILNSHPTIHHQNIGVPLRTNIELDTSILNKKAVEP